MDPRPPLQTERLRAPLLRLADALNAARVDPVTADALFTDRAVEDTNGKPIAGFETARWERVTLKRREAAWHLRSPNGRVLAQLRMDAPQPPHWSVRLFEL
jgi:hypothetical protein